MKDGRGYFFNHDYLSNDLMTDLSVMNDKVNQIIGVSLRNLRRKL